MSIAFRAVRSYEIHETDFLSPGGYQISPIQQFPLLKELRVTANTKNQMMEDQIVEEFEVDGRPLLVGYGLGLLSLTDVGHWKSIRPAIGNLVELSFTTPGTKSEHFTDLLHEIRQVDSGLTNHNSFTNLRNFTAPQRELEREDLAKLLSLCLFLETLSVVLVRNPKGSYDLDSLLSKRGASLKNVTMRGARLRWVLLLFRCQRLEIACATTAFDAAQIKKTSINAAIKGSKSEVRHLRYLKIVFDRKQPIMCSTLVADLLARVTSPRTRLVLESEELGITSRGWNSDKMSHAAQWICDIQKALEYRRELREALESAAENNGRGYRKILPTPQQRRET